MWGLGRGFFWSAPQHGWGRWGEEGHRCSAHPPPPPTGTCTQLLFLPFSNLPFKKWVCSLVDTRTHTSARRSPARVSICEAQPCHSIEQVREILRKMGRCQDAPQQRRLQIPPKTSVRTKPPFHAPMDAKSSPFWRVP